MHLFREDKHQVFVSPEALLIREFAALVDRDQDGDKTRARQELAYVYFLTDYRSPYLKEPDDERRRKVKRDLRLPAGWEPDGDIEFAILRYREMQETPTLRALLSITGTLSTADRMIGVLRNQIEKGLDDKNLDPLKIEQLVKQVGDVLKLAASMPNTVKTIGELTESVKKEQSNNTTKLRGGGEVGEWEE